MEESAPWMRVTLSSVGRDRLLLRAELAGFPALGDGGDGAAVRSRDWLESILRHAGLPARLEEACVVAEILRSEMDSVLPRLVRALALWLCLTEAEDPAEMRRA